MSEVAVQCEARTGRPDVTAKAHARHDPCETGDNGGDLLSARVGTDYCRERRGIRAAYTRRGAVNIFA